MQEKIQMVVSSLSPPSLHRKLNFYKHAAVSNICLDGLMVDTLCLARL